MIDPLLNEDWSDSVDNNDRILVHTGDLLDECILYTTISTATRSPVQMMYPAVPGVEVVAITCVVLDGEVALPEQDSST